LNEARRSAQSIENKWDMGIHIIQMRADSPVLTGYSQLFHPDSHIHEPQNDPAG
jgi:hypothetical protein